MGKKKHQGRFKPHDYPDGSFKKPQKKHGGNTVGGSEHYAPKHPTLAEGQRDLAVQELLQKRFARLTVMIYAERMSGTFDFEDKGDYIPPQNNQEDPMESFGNIFAGNLFADLRDNGFVCTGAKYRGGTNRKTGEDYGDKKGKNYLYFSRLSDIRPNPKTQQKHYLRPHWEDFRLLQAELERLRVHKVQLFVALDNKDRHGGVKHTLKLFTDSTRGGQLEKPVWKPVAREWVLEPAQQPSQQQTKIQQTQQAG